MRAYLLLPSVYHDVINGSANAEPALNKMIANNRVFMVVLSPLRSIVVTVPQQRHRFFNCSRGRMLERDGSVLRHGAQRARTGNPEKLSADRIRKRRRVAGRQRAEI